MEEGFKEQKEESERKEGKKKLEFKTVWVLEGKKAEAASKDRYEEDELKLNRTADECNEGTNR